MALAPAVDLRQAWPPKDALPASIEAEQALLGAVLFDNGAMERVGDLIRGEHFLEPFHGRVWTKLETGIRRGQLVDPILLSQSLGGDPAYEELGGMRYLADLVDRAPPAFAATDYAREVFDLAQRRELIRISGDIAEAARRDHDTSAADQIEAAEKALALAADGGSDASAWARAGDVVGSALERAKTSHGLPGLSTGLRELDEATGGLRRGQLSVLAARPSMGKSTGALQVAKAVSSSGRGVAFFSMEMPHFDLGLRLACDVAHDPYAPHYGGRSENPNYFDASRGRLETMHWRLLDQARAAVDDWPLYFDPRPGLTVPQMVTCARRKIREWERAGVEPGLIILDHLTIARPDQDRRGNKVAEVGDISRGLAEMAKNLDIPVLALCQLSRDVEKRPEKDRRPGLSDLRWSGEIEQDARLVMFLYRPEYYVRRPEDRQDFAAEAEWREKLQAVRHKLFWLIEKNNNGPTGEVETYCDIACSAIRDRLGMGGA